VPFEDVGGTKSARYYQEIAVNNTMAAIAEEKQRILPRGKLLSPFRLHGSSFKPAGT
jgi:hypothetical protein